MNIKRIIREELEWIRETKPTLNNKIILFEPMIDQKEWGKVEDKLIRYNDNFDGEIVWWSGESLGGWSLEHSPNIPLIHHIIISDTGKMVFGAMNSDHYDLLLDMVDDEDDIRWEFQDLKENIEQFILGNPGEFDVPQSIDGRDYFNIPYKSINESEEFNWIKDVKPVDLDKEVMDYINKDYVVAIWFNDMDQNLIKYIKKFIKENDFSWGFQHDTRMEILLDGQIKGITFYPNRGMGLFYGDDARTNWVSYHREVYYRQHDDISPDYFHSVEV